MSKHRMWRYASALAGALAVTLSALTVSPAAAAASLPVSHAVNPVWPHNYMIQPDAAARSIPLQFYRDISKHDDDTAQSLLSARLAPSYENLSQIRYFAQLHDPAIRQLRDITNRAGQLRRDTDAYAAVKVYLGVLTARSSNPVEQASLNHLKYHRFVVVKSTPESPWRLDDDEALSASQVTQFEGQRHKITAGSAQ